MAALLALVAALAFAAAVASGQLPSRGTAEKPRTGGARSLPRVPITEVAKIEAALRAAQAEQARIATEVSQLTDHVEALNVVIGRLEHSYQPY